MFRTSPVRTRIPLAVVCALALALATAVATVAASRARARPLTPVATAGGPTTAAAVAPTNARIFAGTTTDPATLALRAYVWGAPLLAAAQARLATTDPAHPFAHRSPYAAGAALDNIGFQRKLSSPAYKAVTPNNTTLYAPAWLDTDHGPFVLLTPSFGRRYYTFQFAQADTSTRQSLGQRVDGPRLKPVFVYGPSWHGRVPRGFIGARSTFRYMFILGRILVDPSKPGDVAAVRSLQNRVKLISWARYRDGARGGVNPVPAQAPITRSGDPSRFAFLYELGRVMSELSTVPDDRALVASFARIGLTAHGFDPSSLSPAAQRQVAQALRAGPGIVARAAARYGTTEHGWSFDFQGPDYGTDWLQRAVIAKVLPFVNLIHESIYPKATTDAAGRPLTGADAYDLHFASGQLPPARFFWSLIAYNAQGYMVDNPIHRYSLGSLTPGLVTNADGSFDIIVSHARPAGPLAANWLPAPAGRFFMVLRLYDAASSVFDGRWLPPRIVRRTG